MKIINNRGFAFAVCVLAAVISIFGLGGGKLSRLRNEAENAFFDDNNGYSAYQDLMERREYAANLLQIAQQTIPEEEVYQSAAEAFDSFTASETPEEYYETNEVLQAAIDELYQALSQAGMEEEAFRRADRQYVDFCSVMSNLRLDDYYNDLAKEYNEVLEAFPTGIIAEVTGNGPLPVFSTQ